MSSVHHELPSSGFATSTIFTLGTDDGIILIHMHTDNNQLHFFGTFIQQGHFDIGYHWTTWRPRENFDAININHEAIVVPVNNEDPVLRTHVNFERFPLAPHPPRYQPQPATPFNIVIPASTTSESSSNETAITPEEAENIPLHITNPDPATPIEETEDDNQSKQYTDTRLLPSDHLLHLAQEEA